MQSAFYLGYFLLALPSAFYMRCVGYKSGFITGLLLFGADTFLFYVGTQVGTWSYFIQYVQEYAGPSEKVAGYFLTGTLVMFGIGRFASVGLMKYFASPKLMDTYCLINVLLIAVAVLHPGCLGV